MYVRLNLATTPLVSHRRFFVGATLLAVVASVLCVFLGWRLYDVRKAEADYRAKSDKLQSEMSRVMAQREELEQFFAREENSNLRERAKLVDAVIEANSFNWTKMFMDLEHTLPPGVHVFRIEPRLEKGTVTVKFVAGASSQEAQVERFQ